MGTLTTIRAHVPVETRAYVRYCLRYAVQVLGKAKVIEYVDSLDRKGDES